MPTRHNPKAPYPRATTVPQVKDRSARRHGPLKVLAYVHKYPPEHNAGAEWALHELMRHLVARGHEARVLADVKPGTIDGVDVARATPDRLAEWYRWADVVVTHLDRTRPAIAWAHRERRPLVHYTHNHLQLRYHRVGSPQATAVVHNSRWIADQHAWNTAPSVVVRPVVDTARFQALTPTGENLVTLINATEPKGAPTLYAVANREPGRRFAVVTGAYGAQMPPPKALGNVVAIDHTPTIEDVYARSRVLFVPSSYESWGRVAIEAMAAGVPVIAHPTTGLKEALGDGAIFANRDNTAAWVAALAELDHPDRYAAQVAAGRERVRRLDVLADLDRAVWIDTLRMAATAR